MDRTCTRVDMTNLLQKFPSRLNCKVYKVIQSHFWGEVTKFLRQKEWKGTPFLLLAFSLTLWEIKVKLMGRLIFLEESVIALLRPDMFLLSGNTKINHRDQNHSTLEGQNQYISTSKEIEISKLGRRGFQCSFISRWSQLPHVLCYFWKKVGM